MSGLRSFWLTSSAFCLAAIVLSCTLFKPAPSARNGFFHHRLLGVERGQTDELVEITTERSDVKTLAHPNTPIVVDDLNFDDDEFKVQQFQINLAGRRIKQQNSDVP